MSESPKDYEIITKAAHTANLLRQDLQAMVSADNPFLSEYALDWLQAFVPIEKKLRHFQEMMDADFGHEA
ncbi:hypothetical protein A4U49_01415 [Acidithiobacillus ferrivorans]|uniref:hypothetical protein n=1 Tax=Acidithiobacillus ferrivorans TaxID=160808 RepID=UPI000892E383|nr:hypothetical protein [Acidithiobacillus ferrivorans]OFA17565.1 hypothetical protein A4U49_01415 [Acidithiobacillus ferrivorans]